MNRGQRRQIVAERQKALEAVHTQRFVEARLLGLSSETAAAFKSKTRRNIHHLDHWIKVLRRSK